LNARELYINASNETGIDVIRGKVVEFVASRGIHNEKKIVILDEIDGMSLQGMQSLKQIMEEYSKHSRFILITNNYNKIIEPIKSRCSEVNFNFETKNENDEILGLYMKRVVEICDKEGMNVKTDTGFSIIAKLVKDCYPDLRKIVGTLQKLYNETGGDLKNAKYSSTGEKLDEIVKLLFKKDIIGVRKYLLENYQNYEIENIFKPLYKRLIKVLEEKMGKESNLLICQSIIIINKYLYQNAFVADKELNIISLFSEIICEIVENCK
jgi:DNA polymerase III delta prime subunit